MSKLEYKEELRELQIELLKLQRHIKEQNLKLLIIFEGRDAAGKGGTIKRITEHLNPRGCRVVALQKPSDVEKTQWYFQRYTSHLPGGGEIVIFDRSWYNRAVVEPVMGFCTKEQTKAFLQEVPLFEDLITRSNVKIFKFFLYIDKKTQKERFKERREDPLKNYKLSPVDEKAQELWNEYSVAIYNMLIKTNSTPWTVIDSNKKKKARINVIKHILSSLDYENKCDPKKLETDKQVVFDVEEVVDIVTKRIDD